MNNKLIMYKLITLSMSLVMGFGPLDEKETTNGASVSLTPTLFEMVAVGSLHK